MRKGEAIKILSSENGFVMLPANQPGGLSATSLKNGVVFVRLSDLCQFVQEHFDCPRTQDERREERAA